MKRHVYNNSAIVNDHELGVNIGQLRNVSVQSVRHVSTAIVKPEDHLRIELLFLASQPLLICKLGFIL